MNNRENKRTPPTKDELHTYNKFLSHLVDAYILTFRGKHGDARRLLKTAKNLNKSSKLVLLLLTLLAKAEKGKDSPKMLLSDLTKELRSILYNLASSGDKKQERNFITEASEFIDRLEDRPKKELNEYIELSLGCLLLAIGKYQDAKKSLAKIIDEYPKNKELYYIIKEFYHQFFPIPEVEGYPPEHEYYEKVPTIPSMILRPKIYKSLKQGIQGIKDRVDLYERLLEVQPQNTELLDELAEIYYYLENPVKAIELLQQIVEISPRNPNILRRLGFLYYEQERYRESLKLLNEVVSDNRFDTKGHLVLGNVLYELGRISEAIQYWKIVEQQIPTSIVHLAANAASFKPNKEKANIAKLYKIIGKSKAMTKVLELVNHVKDKKPFVLIEGEVGVGKELIARDIHDRREIKKGEFIPVTCGALPPYLMESELFGHIKGAFTGAIRDKIGLFEKTNGGTIFLDDIQALPIELQPKLLRVLQEREIRKVGGTETIPVDFRLICATNKNLEDEVRKEKFRFDLLCRIKVVTIKVPPLRERKSDIRALIRYFLSKYNKENADNVTITDEAIAFLKNRDWPGNVRGLENVIQQCTTIFDKGTHITVEDIKKNVNFLKPPDVKTTSSFLILKEMEKQHIEEAIRRANKQAEAAKMLGMGPSTLSKRIKRLKIDNSKFK